MTEILWQGFMNGLQGVWTLARIVIPLMVVLEIFKANAWLDRANGVIAPPFRKIGLSQEGAFPVLVATVFGLTFGSGVILANIREGRLSQEEIRISGTFMAICHALIEDTLLFAVLGVPIWILVMPRLVLAVLASYVVFKGTQLWIQWRQGKSGRTKRSSSLSA